MGFVLIVVVLGGLILVAVGWLGWQGKLPRQRWAGIRTPYSMRSDENWYATHRFGAPFLIFGGVAIVAAGLALLPFAIAGALPGAFVITVTLVLAGVAFLSAIASWLFGVSRAKAAAN